QVTEAAQHTLFGMLTNRAGVEQDDIGIFGLVGCRISGATQHCGHRLRIGDVHLASVGLEVDPGLPRIYGCGAHRAMTNLRSPIGSETTAIPIRHSSASLGMTELRTVV